MVVRVLAGLISLGVVAGAGVAVDSLAGTAAKAAPVASSTSVTNVDTPSNPVTASTVYRTTGVVVAADGQSAISAACVTLEPGGCDQVGVEVPGAAQ